MSSTSRSGSGRELAFPPDTSHPAWSPYRGLLRRLPPGRFPSAADLTALLPGGVTSAGGAPISFVSASATHGVDYERHIYESGQVSTREDNWHDLFNALVWCRLPRLKAALNALHYRHLDEARNGRRGAVRDALTLLDESGALVVGTDPTLLDALAQRDWMAAFQRHGAAWGTNVHVIVCGHALLEKLLKPYKAITAQVLLLDRRGARVASRGEDGIQRLDGALAAAILDRNLLSDTAALSPLPIAGIPGWWSSAPQDQAFYSDPAVFRAVGRGANTVTKRPIELVSLEESP